jgi:hypothetical protein
MRFRAYKALALLPALILCLIAIGCGSDGTNVGGGNEAAPKQTGEGGGVVVAFDPRDRPIRCFDASGVPTSKDERYDTRINIEPATSGAYIEFTGSLQDAISRSLRDTDDASGAQAIGPALFTVGDLSDEVAEKIEECLDARGVRYG